MRTKSPEKWLPEIIRHATEVFCIKGYRQSQMSDVAKSMGIAVGTLYSYIESKEALFDLMVRQGFNNESINSTMLNTVPVPTPEPGATLAYLKTTIYAQSQRPRLDKALQIKRAKDIRSELTDLINELWEIMLANRWGLFLISRSALDFPELVELFISRLRRPLLTDLSTYLEMRKEARQLVASTNGKMAAILIVETIMWAIVNRLCDPEYQLLSDDEVNKTVVTSLVNAFVR